MHAGFTLADATAVIDYLHALGVTHAYTSSLLEAKPGSTHGYDVTDHARLNPELGTETDLAAFAAALHARGMGLILDVVPNHMSVGGPNAWWHDVLEHGRASRYADHFDIAWDDHPREPLRGKVLLPILGERYGAAVDSGVFALTWEGGRFALRVYDNRLPLDPGTLPPVLAPVVDGLAADDLAENEARSVLTAMRNLPPRGESEKAAERGAESVAIKRRLAALAEQHPALGDALAARAAAVSASPEELDRLIDAQAYRPCYWRVASDEINYRRFFDVNDLAALATERENVFADVHRLVFQWLADGLVDGLRIDHVDGMFDPKQYLDRLQANAPDAARPLYVVVEKILAPREQLPPDWATAGTTGYEFAAAVNGLFVDPAGEAALTAVYDRFTGRDESFADLAYRCRFLVLQSSLTSELHVLAGHLDRVAQLGRWSRDFTLNGLRHALREVLACFPAYRSYVTDAAADTDKAMVHRAARTARRRNPSLGPEVFAFICDTLLLKDPPDGGASDEYRAAQRRFAGKFQQLTAPVTAKGVEDTALYRFNRLVGLNEVGGHPARFGTPPDELHAFLQTRGPGGLSPLSTHDTKRSEDVRARLAVLSELGDEFGERVGRWADLNRRHKTEVEDGVFAPDANEEWLLYQTLLGAWPLGASVPDAEFVARIQAYMTKALREAKENSSWLNPNDAYDAAVAVFVERVLGSAEFLADFLPFQQTVARHGMTNSLAQTLLRCTAPGVPDTYQGTEVWDFSLVDPDNRRLVNYERRRELLESLDAAADRRKLARELAAAPEDGRIKLYVTSRALRLRREMPEVFAGGYEPVGVLGARAECVFSFVRHHVGWAVLVAVPRLVTRLDPPAWGNTRLEPPVAFQRREWVDLFTDRTATQLTAADLFADFPVVCLVSK
jgi:(1->4)-alpha-D-glucan 1-alpha-D-glucosylmutase